MIVKSHSVKNASFIKRTKKEENMSIIHVLFNPMVNQRAAQV